VALVTPLARGAWDVRVANNGGPAVEFADHLVLFEATGSAADTARAGSADKADALGSPHHEAGAKATIGLADQPPAKIARSARMSPRISVPSAALTKRAAAHQHLVDRRHQHRTWTALPPTVARSEPANCPSTRH